VSLLEEANTMAAPLCVSLMVLLGSLSLPDIALPLARPVPFDGMNVTAVHCRRADLAPIRAAYSDTGLSLALLGEASNLSCTLSVSKDAYRGNLTVALTVSRGEVDIVTTRQPGTCMVRNATAEKVSIRPVATVVALAPVNHDLQKKLAKSVATLEAVAAWLVQAAVDLMPLAMENHYVHPLQHVPAPLPGTTDIRDNGIIQTLNNVVQGLPTIDGIAIGLTIPAANALHIDVLLKKPVSLKQPDVELYLPAGVSLSMDVVFSNFTCGAVTCVINNGVAIMNMRLTGAGEVDLLVNNLVAKAIEAIVADVFKGAPMFLPMRLPDATVHYTPPTWIYMSGSIALITASVAVLIFAYHRHKKNRVYTASGDAVPMRTLMIGDVIIVVACCVITHMFAFGNYTSSATMVVGGNYIMYAFSLVNTVRDLWNAGVYPLSIFVALFSGIYPYFKLFVIVLYSVVLQRPQSRVLQTVDMLGKFSFIDIFMMVQMANSLAIPGIIAVNMLPSFWIFMAATIGTIMVGNYATHGWRYEHTKAGDDAVDYIEEGLVSHATQQLLNDDGSFAARQQTDDERRLIAHNHWLPQVCLPATVITFVGGALSLALPSLRYNISGLATLISGTSKTYSLYELFTVNMFPLAACCIVVVHVMPVLLAVTFPKVRLLAAWSSSDAFLLACVAGLLQIEQFVSFIVGPVMAKLYIVHCELLWPIYALAATLVVQWFLIARAVMTAQ
jgi:hypothetical protein